MKATVYRNDQSHRTAELSHAECIVLSKLYEVAAVVSHEETFGGLLNVYVRGTMMQYDPVEGDIIGSHAEFDPHLGWVS